MTNIIAFPQRVKKEAEIAFEKPQRFKRLKAFLVGMIKIFQVFLIMGWPFIRWFFYLDLLFAFLRMSFHRAPHADLIFALHVILYLTVAWFAVIPLAGSTKK